MLNKRGQLSDTMTWIVATLIIIVILIVFVLASQVLAKWKGVTSIDSIKFKGSQEGISLISLKNSFAFEENPSNKMKIEEWLNEG